MKKSIKKIKALLLLTCMLFVAVICPFGPATASAEELGYTYNYDYWGDVQYSPDAYSVAKVFTSTDLGLDKNMNSPEALFVKDNMIYCVDTKNERILQFERTGVTEIKLVREISELTGTDVTTFNHPTDVNVSDDYIYVCDRDNNRIVRFTHDLVVDYEYFKPVDKTFNSDFDFQPTKLSVDSTGRVYCIALNVNKGLIKFEADGTFAGFIGATPVTYKLSDYIWKRIASLLSKEARNQLENFVPTEYDNLYMDKDGFIYVCTTHCAEAEVDSGSANPVRKLNMLGSDILVRNGNWFVIGDIYWGDGGGKSGISQLVDVTTLDNDTYFLIDKNRGRVFGYDSQGRLLYAFGGIGNMDGYFKTPVSIEHMGHDILVLDSLDCSITLFTPTEYGALIYDAIETFDVGDYETSEADWRKIVSLNGNYDLAYYGIGRALLRQDEYKEAMSYFKLKYEREDYSKAYKQYRKEWTEKNIGGVITVLLIIIFVPMIIKRIKAIKFEIDHDEYLQRKENELNK